MQITYCLPQADYFTRGHRGRVTHALGVISGLANNGVDLTVLAGPRGDIEPHQYPANVHREEVPAVAGWLAEMRWRRRMLQRLRQLIAEQKPHAIIIRYSSSFGGWSSWFLQRQTKRQRHQCRWGFEINSLLYHQVPKLPDWVRSRILKRETAWSARGNFAYVVSEQLQKDLLQGGWPMGKPVLVIPNAGPPPMHDRLVRDDGHKAAQGGARFLYLGVLHVYYDFIALIAAHRRIRQEYPAAELHFFGDGPQEPTMVKAASSDPSIVFHGRYRLDDLLQRGQIRDSDILVLPNVADVTYGSPTKMFEYMALGLPIIASRVGQIGEILEELGAAKLYDPLAAQEDDQSLFQAMRWVLADPQRAPQMRQRIREKYAVRHTWPVRMQQLVEGIQALA